MLAKMAISVKLPKIALSSTARCVLYRYGQARTSPTPPLTHLRFDGILLCEAVSRSATFTPKRKGLWPVKMRLRLSSRIRVGHVHGGSELRFGSALMRKRVSRKGRSGGIVECRFPSRCWAESAYRFTGRFGSCSPVGKGEWRPRPGGRIAEIVAR